MIEKVISGGQVGADIAGLRAAKTLEIRTGGHAPQGWRTKRGPNPGLAQFGLVEHESSYYPPRTRKNAIESNGTIRFARNWNTPGERATLRALHANAKPHFDVTIFKNPFDKWQTTPNPFEAANWVVKNNIRILNVAGNADEEIEGVVEEYVKNVIVNAKLLTEYREAMEAANPDPEFESLALFNTDGSIAVQMFWSE